MSSAVTSTFPGTVPRAEALIAVLSSMFFGVFTVIAAFAVYFTTRKHLKRTSSIAALAITVALYAVSATYTIAVLVTLFHQTQILDDDTFFVPHQDCIGTAALTLTTVLTNAVIWSRVWALWRHNKILYGISFVLLLPTLVLGALVTSDTCPAQRSGFTFFENNRELFIGGFYWDQDTGVAVCWLSLSSNVIAFILYLVKALKLRPEQPLSAGRAIGRHFVRILESGTLFAIIWLLMVVYQTGVGDGSLTTTDGFSFFVNGALIPLLSSFATLVVIFAVTGKSETAFLDDGPSDEQEGLPLSGARVSEKGA